MLGTIGGLYLLFNIYLRKKLTIAIGIVKASANCSKILNQLWFLPLLMTVVGIMVLLMCFAVLLFGISNGTIETIKANNIDGGHAKKISYAAWVRWLMVFNFYMLIYWILVVLGFTDLVISYSISLWYFSKNKNSVKLPVLVALKNVTKYHLGTVFYISLISTFLKFPNMLMRFFRKQLGEVPQYHSWARCVMASCMCCIHAYQRYLRYINKMTYVQTAIFGDKFYSGAKKCYFLLFRNRRMTRDLDSLQAFIIFQIKLSQVF